MKLFIETTLSDMTLILFNDEKKYVSIKKNLKKKSDALASSISELLSTNNVAFDELAAIYITLGPGSFMGARASFVYARTFANIRSIDLYSISTIKLLAVSNDSTIAHIHSKDNVYFEYKDGVESLVELLQPSLSTLDNFIEDPNAYIGMFDKANIDSLTPNYIKDPTIGGA